MLSAYLRVAAAFEKQIADEFDVSWLGAAGRE
jgi:hypothetical protein